MSRMIEIKSDIIEQGVYFQPYDMFTKYKHIQLYKTKKICKKPIVLNNEVYDISDDQNLIPSEIILETKGMKSIVKLRYNPKSIITINLEGDKLIIKKQDEIINDVEVKLIKKYGILEENTKFQKDGHIAKIKEFVDIVGLDRISILFYDGCYNWNCGMIAR